MYPAGARAIVLAACPADHTCTPSIPLDSIPAWVVAAVLLALLLCFPFLFGGRS